MSIIFYMLTAIQIPFILIGIFYPDYYAYAMFNSAVFGLAIGYWLSEYKKDA